MQPNKEMFPYVLYQLETAKDDLDGAKYLIEGEKYRISLNRSYYGVFHTIKALATMYDEKFSKHSGYISYFRKEFIKTEIFEKELSRIVSKTLSLRESSDYGDMILVTKDDAVKDYEAATFFYDTVAKYIQNEISKNW